MQMYQPIEHLESKIADHETHGGGGAEREIFIDKLMQALELCGI